MGDVKGEMGGYYGRRLFEWEWIVTAGSTYKQLNRLRQVLQVLVKHGLGEAFAHLPLKERPRFWSASGKAAPSVQHLTTSQRMRAAMEELGPTFIKMGQILSTRPDVVPDEFIKEFEKLQTEVTPMSFEVVKGVVEEELGGEIDEIFEWFSEEPVASASLSQVHRGKLKGGGSVAVKVQRPNIKKTIQADMEVIGRLAGTAESQLEKRGIINPVGLVQEISADLEKELDFQIEATNMQQYAQLFRDERQIHVPSVYWELCTHRLLTMEFIDGIPVSQLEDLRQAGYDLPLIASRAADASLRSALEYGFFHADPHPGNIMVLPGEVICFLDYGMMGNLSSLQRENLAEFLYHIIAGDERRAVRKLLILANDPGLVDIQKLETDVAELAREYMFLPSAELAFGNLLPRVRELMVEHRLRLPTNMVWLIKAVATAENTARQLDSKFDMVEFVKPYTIRVLFLRFKPGQQLKEILLMAMDSKELFSSLPYTLRNLVHQLVSGRFKVGLEHSGVDPAVQTLKHASNRLSLAIVLAALIMGSSVVVLSDVPPLIGEMPVIGVVGYIVSAILGLWLVIAGLRNRPF
ncbi:MAG: AarF/ABC1/UbiB kinase family protein [Dehalococcoidia bacterium]